MTQPQITFTQTDAAEGVIDNAGQGRFRVVGIGHERTLAQLGAIGRGQVSIVQTSGAAPPAIPRVGVGLNRLAVLGSGHGFAFRMGAVGAGRVPIAGRARSAKNYGEGIIPLKGTGRGVVVSDLDYITLLFFDNVLAADYLDTSISVFFASRAEVGSAALARADARSTLASRVRLHADAAAILREALFDAVEIGETLTADRRWFIRAHDALLLTDRVASSAEAWSRLIDAVALAATTDAALRLEFADAAVFADVLTCYQRAVLAFVDEVVIADTLGDSATFAVVMSDTAVLSDTLGSTAEAVAQLRDGAAFAVHLRIDTGDYTAWSMNTDSQSSTRYTQYPFNSFMRVGRADYGVMESGVYRLGGDDDDGEAINARLRLGMTSLGSRQVKHIPSVYLGYNADGDMLLKAIVADATTGEREAHIYRLHAQGAASTREGRVKLGKGLSAVYWDFELENIDGADFDIDTIEFMPLAINRRVRGNAGGR